MNAGLKQLVIFELENNTETWVHIDDEVNINCLKSITLRKSMEHDRTTSITLERNNQEKRLNFCSLNELLDDLSEYASLKIAPKEYKERKKNVASSFANQPIYN